MFKFDLNSMLGFVSTPGALWGIGIFLVLVVAFIFFWRAFNKRNKGSVAKSEETDMADTIGLQPAVTNPSGTSPSLESSSPPVSKLAVPDTAAAPVQTSVNPEPANTPAAAGNVATPVIPKKAEVIRETLKVGKEQKYKAVIKWYPKPGRTPIIEFTNKIDKPLGGLYFAEPSCPVTGEVYYVKQNKDHTFSPYDPRENILSADTPYTAYHALHWVEAIGVWARKKGNWMASVSTIAVVIAAGVVFVLVLVKVGG
jgi:hypothetical protein